MSADSIFRGWQAGTGFLSQHHWFSHLGLGYYHSRHHALAHPTRAAGKASLSAALPVGSATSISV